MKNTLILCLVILWNTLYAQKIIIQEPCAWHKKGTPNREAAHAHYEEETNTLYLTYMGKTKLCLKTYVDMNKVDEFCFERTEDAGLFNQVADAVVKDQKEYYLFFANASCSEFSVESIHLSDKSIQRNPLAFVIGKDEFYLYSFTDQGQFYILTSVKKTSNVRLYKYNYLTHKFDMNVLNLESVKFPNTTKEIKLWDIISDDNTISYADIDVFKYSKSASPQSEIDPKVVSRAMKFYDRKGHLMITIDGYNNMTYLIDLDLESYKFIYKTYVFEKIGALSNETQKNSYLFENTLMQVKVSDEKMIASIVDVETKQVLKTFSCLATDSLNTFSNTPIYKIQREKGLIPTPVLDREIKRVKKMFRICSENNVFIGAIRTSNNEVELTIGSFFVENRTTPAMMGPGGSGIGGHGGSTVAVENTYFFKSRLSQDFSKRISGYLDESYYDMLLDRRQVLKCPSKAQTIFNIKGNYYLGYFFSTYPNTKEGDVEDFYYVEKFGSN